MQEFIFSVSWVVHVATAYPASLHAHLCISVDCNMILWLVNLHSHVFIASLRLEWLVCRHDRGVEIRENSHLNTVSQPLIMFSLLTQANCELLLAFLVCWGKFLIIFWYFFFVCLKMCKISNRCGGLLVLRSSVSTKTSKWCYNLDYFKSTKINTI